MFSAKLINPLAVFLGRIWDSILATPYWSFITTRIRGLRESDVFSSVCLQVSLSFFSERWRGGELRIGPLPMMSLVSHRSHGNPRDLFKLFHFGTTLTTWTLRTPILMELYKLAIDLRLKFLILLPSATKLGQGYVFTGVCHSVNRGVSALGGRKHPPPGADTLPGPDTPWSRHPPEQTPQWSRHPPLSRPPGADTPWGLSTPPGTKYTPWD